MSKTKSGLENSQGQRLHNFSVQPAPLFDCPWGQEVSTYIKVDSVSFQILAIISYPPSMFVSFLTLIFSWTPHKYLGTAVSPPQKFPASSDKCPQLEFTPVSSVSYWARDPNVGPWLQSHKGWGEVLIIPVDLLAVLPLVQPKVLLHFTAARTHCWLTPTLPSTRTCKSSSAELLQSCSTPANQGPACVNSGTLPSQLSHLAFLYFDFLMVPAGLLLQPACILLNGHPALKHVSWSCGLISSANLITVHSIHLLRVTEKWENYLKSNH